MDFVCQQKSFKSIVDIFAHFFLNNVNAQMDTYFKTTYYNP